MAFISTLQTLDIKKIIEQSAYFLLLSITLELVYTFFLFLGLFTLDVTGLPLNYPTSPVSTQLMGALIWGVSRSIKIEYTSLAKAPAVLISLLFILSVGALSPQPLNSAGQLYTAIKNPQKHNPYGRPKLQGNPTNTRASIAILSFLSSIVISIPAAIIGLIPLWILLRSGYILTKIYFKRPSPSPIAIE